MFRINLSLSVGKHVIFRRKCNVLHRKKDWTHFRAENVIYFKWENPLRSDFVKKTRRKIT